jgi:hypothetical protein
MRDEDVEHVVAAFADVLSAGAETSSRTAKSGRH